MKIFRLAFLSFLFFSCKKIEFDKISSTPWNPKLAVPIAYGTFTINDILKQADSIDKYIDPNARPVLQFSTTESIKGFSISSAVKLPDFNTLPEQSIYSFSKLKPDELSTINNVANSSVGDEIDFLKTLLLVDKTTNFNSPQTVPLNFSSGSDLPSGFRIDQIDFSSGKIQVNVTKGLPHRTVLKFTFNDIKKNGNKLVDSIVYIPNSNTPMMIDLAGYYADFSANQLSYTIDAIKITPTSSMITSNDSINLDVSMTGLGFKSIQGYFGNLKIDPIDDTLTIDQLKDLKGTFGITNPSIKLKVVNGFGIPVQMGFDKFKVIYTDNTVYPINVNAPFEIGYPRKIGGSDVTSTLELTKNTVSNIDKLISSQTQVIQLGGSLVVNKDGENVAEPNFITDKSTIDLEAEVKVPLTGYVSGFTFADTSTFSLTEDVIKSLQLKLNYKNTLPLNIDASITFLDASDKQIFKGDGTKLDLLSGKTGILIKSPDLKYDALSNSWKLSESDLDKVTEQSASISVQESDLPYLKKAAKIVFSGSFETFGGTESKPVTLYDYYGLSFKLMGNVTAKIPIKK
jgi:hypothetical protein